MVTGIATTPTNITFSLNGCNTLELAWPEPHLGWIVQSNAASVVDTNLWFDIAGLANRNEPEHRDQPGADERLLPAAGAVRVETVVPGGFPSPEPGGGCGERIAVPPGGG